MVENIIDKPIYTPFLLLCGRKNARRLISIIMDILVTTGFQYKVNPVVIALNNRSPKIPPEINNIRIRFLLNLFVM